MIEYLPTHLKHRTYSDCNGYGRIDLRLIGRQLWRRHNYTHLNELLATNVVGFRVQSGIIYTLHTDGVEKGRYHPDNVWTTNKNFRRLLPQY